MIIGARGDVVVKIFGDDISELNRITREVAGRAAQDPGVARRVRACRTTACAISRRASIALAAGRFGLNAGEIQDALRVWVDGQPGRHRAGRADPHAACSSAARKPRAASSVDFARVPMVSAERQVVELSQTRRYARGERADPGHSRGRPALRHRARQCARARSRRLRRRSQSRGRRQGQDAAGIHAINGAASSRTSSAPRRDSRSSCRSRSALIFLLLYLTFRSVLQATLVFCNVPFAAIGGILGAVAFGRVPVGAGLGRLYRADRHRRAQRRRADLLHQQARGRRRRAVPRSRDGGRAPAHAAGDAHRDHRGLRLDAVPVRAPVPAPRSSGHSPSWSSAG